jgi:hypothetical protein
MSRTWAQTASGSASRTAEWYTVYLGRSTTILLGFQWSYLEPRDLRPGHPPQVSTDAHRDERSSPTVTDGRPRVFVRPDRAAELIRRDVLTFIAIKEMSRI